ncbi:MAG: stage sporulation protein [Tepidanaerobacteraceae bacterium]|nr:stage sporulation protein [Tepidanaerobacteraceae bacterium]
MGRKLAFLKKIALATAGIAALSLLAAIFSGTGIAGGPVENFAESGRVTADEISGKIIRLHIIANSDCPEDQALKLRVRDDIIKAFDNKIEGIDDIDASREYIKTHLKDIEQIALQEIKKSGKDYSVKVVFGKFMFPVKTYGYITLPAGEYEALRVIIGKGEGANWWCVLFPPLCFVDITHGLTSEEAKTRLHTVLSERELAAVETASSPEEIPIQVRFKIVEWWNIAKSRINKSFRLAFK